ncbi:hypothetical protein BASA83_012880 [Batrachochytrium salamandrivorans]|nr:hypothetical protein BASA83_012880 [Batrachochytrium salamandrivorans]
MQLDNNSVPEIVVGVECAGKSANTNGVPASTFCGNTTMTATAAIKSRRAARVNSGNSTRQNGSSLPAIVVEAKCTSKRLLLLGSVRKPRGGKVMAAAVLLFWWMVMPRFARMGQPVSITSNKQVEGYSESVFLPLDTDSFKAPLSGLSVSPALSETGATAADILCHLDSATPQTQLRRSTAHGDVKGGAGVRWWPLTRHFSKWQQSMWRVVAVSIEQDAAHMSPERADTEHFPIPVPLISNTLPAPAPAPSAAAAAARHCRPRHPATGVDIRPVATPAVGSGPARANNKRAAAELTDSDTIIAAAPKRLCKS